MLYAALMLDGIVAGEQVFGIIVFDVFQGSVFPFFRADVIHNGHGHLRIGVISIAAGHYKIAFQFPDASDADVIAL